MGLKVLYGFGFGENLYGVFKRGVEKYIFLYVNVFIYVYDWVRVLLYLIVILLIYYW